MDSEEGMTQIHTAVHIEVAGRLSRLWEQLRTTHLNEEECVTLVKICEEYKRMPVGLKGAPSTFQRLMSTVFSGTQGLKCLVYLDDIIIFGENLKVHNERLKRCICQIKVV